MAFGSEIKAKLGVDTTSVGTDLAGAKNQFNKWGQELAATGGTHGSNFGGQLVGKLEHKIVSARHLSGALAAALGFNIEKIVDHIASAITGGNAEAWAEVGKIEDEHMRLLKEKYREALTPKKLVEELQKELQDTVKKLSEIKGKVGYGGEDEQGGAIYKEMALTAEQGKERAELLVQIDKLEKQIRDTHKDDEKAVKKYEETRKKAAFEELSDGHKVEELQRQISELIMEGMRGDLTKGELAEKQLKIGELQKEVKAATLRIEQEGIKFADKGDADRIKAAERVLKLAEATHKVESARAKLAEDQNKLTDESKMTVGELASLQGKSDPNKFKTADEMLKEKKFGSDEGLDPNIVAAKRTAQQIEALKEEAEQKRLAGDQTGFRSALDQAGVLTKQLSDSGQIKSSEAEQFTDLAKQIKDDGEALLKATQEVAQALKGKFVSQ